jgi:integrase
MDAARALLTIAGDDKELAVRIADIITATIKDTGSLPDPSEVRRRVRTGQQLDQRRTVAEWLNLWLAGKQRLRDSSTASYAAHIRLYFNPIIGHIRLDRLLVSDVAQVFEAIDELNETIDAARQTGDPAIRAKVKGRRPVGPATKHRIRATLRSALNTAIKQRLIDFNPAAVIELPSAKRPKALVWTPERIAEWRQARVAYVEQMRERKRILAARSPHGAKLGTSVAARESYVGTPRPSPVMVWTPEQTKRFLDRAEGHRLFALFHLIAFRGLRRGEGCGLRWPELDLINRVATVRWQIVQIGATITQGAPKSDAGDRQVALDRRTINVLLVHKARQNALILPVVRGDYRAIETYRCAPGPRLACPLTVLVGDADPLTTVDEARAWSDHTTGDVDVRVFPGGHFYIEQHQAEVVRITAERLAG